MPGFALSARCRAPVESVEAAVRPGAVSPVVDGRRDRADRPARRVHAVADGLPGLPDAAEAAGGPGERADHDLLPGLDIELVWQLAEAEHRHRHPRDRQPARARGPAELDGQHQLMRGVAAPPQPRWPRPRPNEPRPSGRRTVARSPGPASPSETEPPWASAVDSHDGQPEPGRLLAGLPGCTARCRARRAKRPKRPFGIFGGNPWPVVGYGEHRPPAVRPAPTRTPRLAACLTALSSSVHQQPGSARRRRRVTTHGTGRLGLAPGLGPWRSAPRPTSAQRGQVGGRAPQELPVQPGEQQQVLGQPGQPQRVGVHVARASPPSPRRPGGPGPPRAGRGCWRSGCAARARCPRPGPAAAAGPRPAGRACRSA